MGEVAIRRATLGEIVALRHEVLRAGLPPETAIFEGDDGPDARHCAAVCNGRVIGCATFHPSEWQGTAAWQLRGMATAADARGRGVGRHLLTFLERDLVTSNAARPLWCNARVPAVGFYERLGWTVVSDVFHIPTAGPHVRMTKPLAV